MHTFDPARDLASLHRLRTTIDELLELRSAELSIVVAEVSAWSPEHHLAHVTLANELVLRNVGSLAKGSGMLVVKGGEPHPRALAILAAGRLPRGEAQSPRIVRPPERVDRELFLRWLADVNRELDLLRPEHVVASELKVPHQLLGPLDATQWLRFGAVHTRHHLAIAIEALARRGHGALPELDELV